MLQPDVKHKRLLLLFIGTTLLMLLGYALLLVEKYYFAGLDGMTSCSEDVVARTVSPSKKYVVSLGRRSCGATTPFASRVFIQFNPEVNLDSLTDEVTLWQDTTSANPSIEWQGETSLAISGETNKNFSYSVRALNAVFEVSIIDRN